MRKLLVERQTNGSCDDVLMTFAVVPENEISLNHKISACLLFRSGERSAHHTFGVGSFAQ